MRIIQESNVPKWQHEATCHVCSTIMILEGPKELFKELSSKLRRHNTKEKYTYYCKCPKCKQMIFVAPVSVSPKIRKKVKFEKSN